MSFENPYEPPSLPAEMVETPWPTSGAYRDGRYLVLHSSTALPGYCIRSGKTADTHVTRFLQSGQPNDGSVLPTGRRWNGERYFAIAVPMHSSVLRRAKRFRLVAYLFAAIALIVLGVSALLNRDKFFYGTGSPSGWTEQVLVWTLFLLIASLAFLAEPTGYLRLESVAHGYFWISKAKKAYLQQLPQWPVPRPTWWRRMLFGPAGVSTPGTIATPMPSPRVTPPT